jgi:4'-phosphopantetheinyl transferase
MHDLAALYGVLSAEEQARVQNYRSEKNRVQAIISRGYLRFLLGRYLDVDPVTVPILTTEFGKPYLPDNAISFNVSHAMEQLVYGLTVSRNIGVDIESIARKVDHLGIAERFFTEEEIMAIKSVSEDARAAEFLKYWTLKEAYLKATGMGLAGSLHSFSVVPDPAGAVYRIQRTTTASLLEGWTLRHFCPVPGYMTAVAVEGEGWNLKVMAADGSLLSPE